LKRFYGKAGLAKNIEDVRPINEARMKARHKLGALLKPIDRAQGCGPT
jgi:hypothetical protein